MPNEDGLYTKEEVLGIASKMLANISAKDLTNMVSEELQDGGDLGSFLSKVSTTERKELIDSEFGKGRKKASRKTERLIAEFFPNEDFKGLEQEEIFQIIAKNRNKKSTEGDSKIDISFEQALQIPEVASAFNQLQTDAARAAELESEFSTYKKQALFLEYAIPMLEDMGAAFSKDPIRRKRQISSLLNDTKGLNFKEDSEHGIVFVDGDGNRLMNKDEARLWDTKEYLKTLSPVDFVESVTTKDKTPYVPDTKGGSSDANFGYSKEQITKGFTYDDIKSARKNGEPAKADFMLKVMEENYANKNK